MLWRRAKVGILQARRLLSWAVEPARWRPPPLATAGQDFDHCVYHRDIVIARADAGADPTLERGKWINLTIAAPHFNGLLVSPERPLSFWRVLGRVTAARGFQHGMELRGGCIVPTLGGGLCLLSNALFQAACALGWTIVQRHGHTVEAVPDEADIWGLDATVFWPHVDLVVAPSSGRAVLTVQVVGSRMFIRVHSDTPRRQRTVLRSIGDVTFHRDGQPMRANRVVRDFHDLSTGRLCATDIVADNCRRLLHVHEMRRNCLTCNQTACSARPRDLPDIIPADIAPAAVAPADIVPGPGRRSRTQ